MTVVTNKRLFFSMRPTGVAKLVNQSILTCCVRLLSTVPFTMVFSGCGSAW